MQSDPTTTKSSNPKDILAANEQRVLLHLIPSPALIKMALALMDGAKKYGPYNWRKEGVSATTYISAAQRHIAAWLDGEEDAADSGAHHLGHALACLAIILDGQAVGNLVDDRPATAPTAALLEREKNQAAPLVEWSKQEDPESWDEEDRRHGLVPGTLAERMQLPPEPWYVKYPDDLFDVSIEKESISTSVIIAVESGQTVRYGDRERASYVARIMDECIRGRVYYSEDDAGWYVALVDEDKPLLPDAGEVDLPVDHLSKELPYVSGPLD